ncbi:hypothetical protein HBH56_233050 [Parastagonospora nodorum]|uniref:Uncharacterized protein n=2 Tax=Phaeosphaeria nodorum (strain SN15 / ATCC MYA-4574 / FGSC 10173) TaxID=321614 RepID=A0A7U2ID58_PHANO|nr:hypothetical protein SNOG_16252 [Parastagonospora nodorum SN15]KAH3904591.1 hypothetical protein HBH56_233050 [Parastagonospora nodorum]EAT76436.1 hypothetical protein SNOG_16252 [Parastagonospora nodorum SN15]KAH3921454.1 hypothetical protein HBH54_240010 [Parastagonospora nodorum]KAH4125419.1 hypothetical protein HBH45_231130 [Parastagonospora nodorum]KAH4147796.1 hypothetical protein HBH44_220120 [Parastagonospora nodorum]
MPTEDQPRPNRPTLPRRQRHNASVPQLSSNVHGGISRLVPIINPYDKLYHQYESRNPNNGTNPYARMYHNHKSLGLMERRRQFQSRELSKSPAESDDLSSYSPSDFSGAQNFGSKSPSLDRSNTQDPATTGQLFDEQIDKGGMLKALSSTSERAGIPGEAEDMQSTFIQRYLDVLDELKEEKVNNEAIVAELKSKLETAQQAQREAQSNPSRRMVTQQTGSSATWDMGPHQLIDSLKKRVAQLEHNRDETTAKHSAAIERYEKQARELRDRVDGLERINTISSSTLKECRVNSKDLENTLTEKRRENKELRDACRASLATNRVLQRQLALETMIGDSETSTEQIDDTNEEGNAK